VARVEFLVRKMGGMAQKRQLVAQGITGYQLTAATRRGEITRVRNGWYSTLAEEDPALRAVRVGGRLTGISAVQALGGWVHGEHELHVSLADNAARMRTAHNRFERLQISKSPDVRLHWDSADVVQRGTATSVALADALYRLALNENFETTVASFDWAMHTGFVDEIDLHRIVNALPRDRRAIAGWVDRTCESLPESFARTRLRLAGHAVETQVNLRSFQRIDLVVDSSLGIEVDGDEFHREFFERDRDKDIEITLEHLHALRVSARTVFTNWPRFARAVETALEDRGVTLPNSGLRPDGTACEPGLSGWRSLAGGQSPEF